MVAQVLGRDLTFEAQPNDEARREMSAAMPAEYVDATFSFFADRTVDESTVLPTVEGLLGRSPRSYLQWAHAHVKEVRESSHRSAR